MHRIRIYVILVVCLLAISLPRNAISAGKSDSPEILEVKKTFACCQELRGKADTKGLSLFRVARNATEAGRWQSSGPEGDNEVAYSKMTIFVTNKKIHAADLYEKTPSGDWQQTTSYCYRPDGTLAFVWSVLRTFYGNVSVEDRLYFNRAGKNIRSLQYVSDLVTNKRVNTEDRGFMDRKPHIFPSTQAIIDEVGRMNVFPQGE